MFKKYSIHCNGRRLHVEILFNLNVIKKKRIIFANYVNRDNTNIINKLI